MTEKQPEEERQIASPVSYDCPNEKHKVKSAYTNTLYVRYLKQPWLDHVRVVCPKDGFTGLYWLDSGIEADWAAQFMSYEQDFCDEGDILEVRRNTLGITDIEPIEISDRAEKMVAKWGEFLQQVTVDVTDFINYGEE